MTPVSLIKTISIKTVDIMINFKHLFDNGKVIYSANCYGHNDLELAFKYFYLDELFSDYNLYENERLKIYVMDGEEYLISTTKTYDVIFNDAYVSDKPAEGLITFEAVSLVKKHLNPNGVYVINIITAVSGKAAYPLFSELAYVKQIFKYTEFYKCRDDVPANEKQNCLIFASDMPFK